MSKDSDYIQRAAAAIERELPEGHGFILLVAAFGEKPRMRYTASVDQTSAQGMLTTAVQLAHSNDWLEHL